MVNNPDVPVLVSEKPRTSDSIVDEKASLKDHDLEPLDAGGNLIDLKAAALADDVGDVYDNLRAIDLGADGKERPIGMCLLHSPLCIDILTS